MTMRTLLPLLIIGGLAQEVVGGTSCDDDCKAVLAAALQWTIEKSATEPYVDSARMYVDVSLIKNEENRGPERQVLGQIARAMSLPIQDMSRHPVLVGCAEARLSSACRAAAGLTSITAHRVNFTRPGHATVYSVIRVLGGGGGEGSWDSLRRSELLLERVQGTWKVVGVGVTVVS
jgi:hypothetical protein